MFAFPVNPNFFDLANAMAAAAAGCPPGATACATAGARKHNAPSTKKAPSPAPKPAPSPAPKPAPVDVVAVETADGWAYSIDVPGRPLRSAVDIEVVASTDAGPPRLVITAPSVPGGAGKRARGALHIAFDLERDADAHSVAANADDGELVITVRKLEPVKPVKIKVAIGGGTMAATEEAAAPVTAPADADNNNNNEDGSWVDDDDDDDNDGSAKGGAPKKTGAVLEAVDDE